MDFSIRADNAAFRAEVRWPVVTTIYGGTSEVQRGIIAERGLGLPCGRRG